MESMKAYPVLLNIYELTPPTGDQNGAASVSLFSRILKPLGFGAYHTSLEINGYCYTFSAMVGIQKSSSVNKSSHVPTNGEFKESIKLGTLSDYMDQNKINECINRLRRTYFTNKNYHIAGRNCNHFTETLATALFLLDDQFNEEDENKKNASSTLKTYPSWVNRLAKSGANLLKQEDICDVMKEARFAADVDGKVNWDFKSTDDSCKKTDRSQKKNLTEEQKKALAKLRKK